VPKKQNDDAASACRFWKSMGLSVSKLIYVFRIDLFIVMIYLDRELLRVFEVLESEFHSCCLNTVVDSRIMYEDWIITPQGKCCDLVCAVTVRVCVCVCLSLNTREILKNRKKEMKDPVAREFAEAVKQQSQTLSAVVNYSQQQQ
jgi:hypothetical protein